MKHGAGKLRSSWCQREVNGRLMTFDSMRVSISRWTERTVTDTVCQEDEAGRRKQVAGDRERWKVDICARSEVQQDPALLVWEMGKSQLSVPGIY